MQVAGTMNVVNNQRQKHSVQGPRPRLTNTFISAMIGKHSNNLPSFAT